MPHLDHTAFVNSCRAERSVGHHMLRAYAQDPRTVKSMASPLRIQRPRKQ